MEANQGLMKAIEALSALAVGDEPPKKKHDWTKIEVGIRHEGKEITLPAIPGEMQEEDAILVMQRSIEEKNIEYTVSEHIPGAYWDAALAFYRAMQQTYGPIATRGTKTFFGERPPHLMTIATGPGPMDKVQLPLGQFKIPGIKNPVSCNFDTNAAGVPGFVVSGKVKRKEQAFLIELCNLARELIQTESIYRGRAIRLRVDSDGGVMFGVEPEFLDLSKVQESDLIFPMATAGMVQTNLFTPMKRTATCRQHNIPLKRTILMEGPYGCGKTLTARVAARVASDNGWTFIMLDRPQGLKTAIEFARLYQPAAIFAEDIDRVAEDRDDDEDVNDLVNIMDGILTKDVEIICVLTTNFVDRIDKALLRPGRFDAVISIEAPDRDAVERLLRHYAGSLIEEGLDLDPVGDILAGQIPATIREVTERSKLSMIQEERNHLTTADLKVAAIGMTRHLDLLADKKPEPSPGEKLAAALQEVVGGGNGTGSGSVDPTLARNADLARRFANRAHDSAEEASEKAGNTYDAVGGLQHRVADIDRNVDKLTETVAEVAKIVKKIPKANARA